MTQLANTTLFEQLGLKTGNTAVVGLQWGDEGKGKIVDLLASHTGAFQWVARYNGGANAGHTVVVEGVKYALHLMPSGILSADKRNVLGNGVVIDATQVVKEVTQLRAQGVKVDTDNLLISDRAHVVFPWHKTEDQLLENISPQPIGTTGRGIGPCYADKALRVNAIRMGDLLLDSAETRIRAVCEFKNRVLKSLAESHDQPFEPFNADEVVAELFKAFEVLGPMIQPISGVLNEALKREERILFEGANATLLDIDHGTYPYVTSSSCSALGVHSGTGVAGHYVPNIIGICKAYQTRVGEGPMPTELENATSERIREVGREYGTTTGRPRRCGWLDLVALKYTTRTSGVTAISLMLLDVLAGLNELKLCVAYEIDGQRVTEFPAQSSQLERAVPIYEDLAPIPGCPDDLGSARSIEDLPTEARAYIKRIEQATGIPVIVASVGPGREQTALRTHGA